MPNLSLEIAHGFNNGVLVAGVDEVGRGPLAGPVVAAAVIIPHHLLPSLDVTPAKAGVPFNKQQWDSRLRGNDTQSNWLSHIQDSKKLSAKQRTALAEKIHAHCHCNIAEATVEEIDSINILQATFLAMQRAVAGLSQTPAHILVDGNHKPPQLPCPSTPVIKGDATSLSIAAASIIAKVYRDALMADLHNEYPHYGWVSNAGYGSAAHMKALATYGATPHHRQSFAPVAAVLTPACKSKSAC